MPAVVMDPNDAIKCGPAAESGRPELPQSAGKALGKMRIRLKLLFRDGFSIIFLEPLGRRC
jgi:hypothetical protein